MKHAARKSNLDRYALAPACILSLCAVVCFSFQLEGSFAVLTESPLSIALSLAAFLILSLIGYLALTFLYRFFDKISRKESSSPVATKELAKKYFPLFFAIIFACWLPWIISHYPGLMRDDSVRQLFQVYGIEPYSGGNPLFDTWVFGLFWNLGDALGNRAWGLYIYSFVQAACTAGSLSFMLCYMKRIGVPKLIVIACLVCVCLISIFPLSAISMSKDSINGWIYVLFFVLFAELCRSKGLLLKSPKFMAALIVVAVLAIITKRTMLYIAAIAFVVYALLNRKAFARTAATGASIIVIATVITSFVLPATMVNNAEKPPAGPPSAGSSFLVIPLQQTARVLAEGLPISQEDYDKLSQLIDCEKTAKVYNPTRADESGWAIRDYTDQEDLAQYLQAWFSIGLQHPLAYTEALISQTYGWFSPYLQIAFGYDLSRDVFDEGHMHLWDQYIPGDVEEAYKFLQPLDTDLPELNGLQAATELIASAEYRLRFIVSFGLWCTWIPLIGFFYALRRRNKEAMCAFLVPGATLLSLLIGPMVLYWYAIPMFYTAPLAFTLGFMRADDAKKQPLHGQAG